MKKPVRLLAAVLCLVLLASCSPSADKKDSAGPTAEATPGPVGETATEPSAESNENTAEHSFTYAISSEPDYLDPAICMNTNTSAVLGQLYYPLFRYDQGGDRG